MSRDNGAGAGSVMLAFLVGAVAGAAVALLYAPGPMWAWVTCVTFTIIGLTDWLDGWVARRWGQLSTGVTD